MTSGNSIYFDQSAREAILAIMIGFLLLSNGFYLFAGILCFAFIFFRLQQPMKPSVFTLIFIYHFLQVIAYVLLCNYTGEDINFRSPSMAKAILCSYIGFFFLFGPVIFYQNKIPNISIDTLRSHAQRFSIQKTFRAYVVSFFIVNALSAIALSLGGFAQVVTSLMSAKWALFTLFGLQVVLTKKMKREFYIAILVEFVMGFFAYFANFKTVMFFAGGIYIIFLQRVYFRHILMLLIACALAFFLGVLWTSIKKEYRSFLNGGTNTQTVSVSRDEALDKIVELSSKQEESSFDAAVNDFLLRLQYTYHFAKTMDRVPSVIPYQQGANWGRTLEFVLTPRALNPDKPTYDATSKTTFYTGIRYAGSSRGTSFSLGYFGDCYIDFGMYGMWFPLLLLGFLYGASYFYFLKNSSTNFLFNYAIVAAIFMEFTAFEMDCTFLLGRLLSTLLVFFLLKVFFFKTFLNYITVPIREEPVGEKTPLLAALK